MKPSLAAFVVPLAFLLTAILFSRLTFALEAQWTLATWSESIPNGPGSRGWVDLTYDPVARKAVLFAGSGGTYYNDIFHFDPGTKQWIAVEPWVRGCDRFVPPSARDEHSVEFDGHNRLYWSFGGSGFGCVFRNSTAQSGSGSLAIVDTSLPSTTPDRYKDWLVKVGNARAYVQSYDATRKILRLATPIAGMGPGVAYALQAQAGGGTWNYNPANRRWTGFDGPRWSYTGQRPFNRLSPAFAYSPKDRAIVMFGGQANNDTWALDVETKTWVRMIGNGEASSPPKRAQLQNSMVYDSHNDVFVLFGGRCQESRCGFGSKLGDTWVYKLSTNTWTRMRASNSPPPREQHHMAYDPVNRVVVLFGGSGTKTFDDLWVYDYSTDAWTKLNPGRSPSARRLGGMTYAPDRNLFVLYGGVSPFSNGRDVWTLKLTSESGANTPPSARFRITPNPGPVETTFQFDGSLSSDADGSIVRYAWTFGDGATATGVTPTHRFSAPGTYRVTVTVTDNDGASATAAGLLEVTGNASAPNLSLNSATIGGAVNDASATITVNGSPVAVSGGAFQFSVPLSDGTFVREIRATNAGGDAVKRVTITVE